MNETQAVISQPKAVSIGFDDPDSFAHVQRVAKVFTSSKLVPEVFQGEANLGNVIIALNMAKRMGADPLAVMQNLDVIHGRPSWRSQFIIACINSCGRYSPLRFAVKPLGKKPVEYEYTRYVGGEKRREKGTVTIEDRECVAWAVEVGTGERLEGPPITVEMAVKEGWYMKSDSKWRSMEELMLRYRAAAFFGRLYAPELLMGMQSAEEVIDVVDTGIKEAKVTEIKTPIFKEKADAPKPADDVPATEPPSAPVEAPPTPRTTRRQAREAATPAVAAKDGCAHPGCLSEPCWTSLYEGAYQRWCAAHRTTFRISHPTAQWSRSGDAPAEPVKTASWVTLLADELRVMGADFRDFQEWCEIKGIDRAASNWSTPDDVPMALAERLCANDFAEIADFRKKFGKKGAQ